MAKVQSGQIQRSTTNDGTDLLFDDLGRDLRGEFDEVEKRRRDYEKLWVKDLRQYLGVYDPETLDKLNANQSRTFVPMTRKKVRMSDARLRDLLFPAGRRGDNWSIKPTEDPRLSPGDERRILEGLTQAANQQRLEAAMAEVETEEEAAQLQQQAQANPLSPDDLDPDDIETARHEFAEQKAARMRTTMSDQMGEMKYPEIAQSVLHSGHLYGIGVMKGPLPERRVMPLWEWDEERGGWTKGMKEENRPFAEFRPLWSLYPDMTASMISNCRFMFEEHLFPKHQVLDLVKQHGFDGEKIIQYLALNPDGDAQEKTHEQELRTIHDAEASAPNYKGYYRLMAREGFMDVNDLINAELVSAEDVAGRGATESSEDEKGQVTVVGEVFATVWMIGHLVVKVEIQDHINDLGELYHFYYCEKGDGNLLDAQGWPRIIRDDQDLVNSGTRATLDNMKVTAGPQVEVETGLLEGQIEFDLTPFKTWYRNSAARDTRRNALTIHTIPNHTAEFGQIIALGERWLHEHSLPAFMEGQSNPHAGNAADTARGLSMLMSAANIELKDLARNYDEGVTEKFVTALYDWNMIWTADDSIKGDFEIHARGSTALIAKEVQAQQTERFLGLMQPFASWVKDDQIVTAIADVTEHGDAIKSKAEHDRDMQNQPKPPDQIEAEARATKAQADLEQAQAQRIEAEAYQAEQTAQAAERLAYAVATVPDPALLDQYASQLGIDINGKTDEVAGGGNGRPAPGQRPRAGDPAVPAGGAR